MRMQFVISIAQVGRQVRALRLADFPDTILALAEEVGAISETNIIPIILNEIGLAQLVIIINYAAIENLVGLTRFSV